MKHYGNFMNFLNLGITNRFCFKSSHFQRIPRFNANNCCIFRTLTVCQPSVQNVWPRLSHSGSLPCEVHTATVLVFWRLGQAGTLSTHPTVTHSQQMPRGGLQPRGNQLCWWQWHQGCRKLNALLIARLISTPSDKSRSKIYSKKTSNVGPGVYSICLMWWRIYSTPPPPAPRKEASKDRPLGGAVCGELRAPTFLMVFCYHSFRGN